MLLARGAIVHCLPGPDTELAGARQFRRTHAAFPEAGDGAAEQCASRPYRSNGPGRCVCRARWTLKRGIAVLRGKFSPWEETQGEKTWPSNLLRSLQRLLCPLRPLPKPLLRPASSRVSRDLVKLVKLLTGRRTRQRRPRRTSRTRQAVKLLTAARIRMSRFGISRARRVPPVARAHRKALRQAQRATTRAARRQPHPPRPQLRPAVASKVQNATPWIVALGSRPHPGGCFFMLARKELLAHKRADVFDGVRRTVQRVWSRIMMSPWVKWLRLEVRCREPRISIYSGDQPPSKAPRGGASGAS